MSSGANESLDSRTTSNCKRASCQSCADYFFGTCLALAASFFFWFAAFAFAFFCAACLLVAFGDLSPINTTLRCPPTGVNSAVGNVPDGLPHRYPCSRQVI